STVGKSVSRIDLKTYGDVLKNTPKPRSNGTGPQIRTQSSGSHHPSKSSSSNIKNQENCSENWRRMAESEEKMRKER
ncbi:hypothetical protein HHI36_002699, partial [Cryptolaemus montrouzieri]